MSRTFRAPVLVAAGARLTPLSDNRIVALARAACALDRALRLPFLRGRWRASHVARVAAAG